MKRHIFPLILLAVGLGLWAPAQAEVRLGFGIGIDAPGVSLRINLPAYPDMVLVPGYPVYYAPRLDANFFFYDGYYWTFMDDNWYASDWYDGPWWLVRPDYVPVFILRIPISYYRHPPPYFSAWPRHQPPHWGDRWGDDWKHRHHDWERWERSATPPPAPLPDYQRRYTRDNYPHREDQERLHRQHYKYERHEHSESTERQRGEVYPPRTQDRQRPSQHDEPRYQREPSSREAQQPTRHDSQRSREGGGSERPGKSSGHGGHRKD